MTRPIAVLCLLLAAAPARAQQRVFALATQNDAGIYTSSLWDARLDAGQVVDARFRALVPGWVSEGPVVTAGGQLVVWRTQTPGNERALVVFDRTDGSTRIMPDVQGLGVRDPTGPRLFVPLGFEIASLTASGFRVIPGSAGLTPIAVSSDGMRVYALMVTSLGPPRLYELRAIDSTTGTSLGAIPIGSNVLQVSVASDEASVWIVYSPPVSPGAQEVVQLLLPSGTERVRLPMPPSTQASTVSASVVDVDVERNRLFVSLSTSVSPPYRMGPGEEIRTFDTATGGEVGRVPHDGFATGRLDAATGTLLLYSSYMILRPVQGCGEAVLRTISASSGEELTRVGLGTTVCLRVAFATPPLPPALNAPAISANRTVTLSWTRSPELIAGFVVEAGSAPELSNLGTFPVTNRTTLTVPNVPPGAYYVRVRAWNYIGGSTPSNEVVVDVR